jgi:two-component system sensor histidine kinase VicK
MAGETVLVEHVATSPDLARREELLALGIESIILAPLRVEQRVIGILGVYRRAPHRFVSEDAGFFELAAELVAISVENARHGEAIDHLMEERTRLMLQVAHNLRAPLSAAATMLETLGESYLGPVNAQQQDTISRIERRLRTMIRVVGELLTLAHTREQHPDTVRSPVDLRALTEQVVATFRDEAIRRGLDLTVSTSPDLPSVLGDADLLQQLVENLASNALKYTLSGGRVEIDLHRSERGGLTLEVRDTGIGIPREEQPRLFSEFFRASNARKLDEDGTGLGLPIIKQIVDRHGGEIQVESEPGKGTRMVVRLPAT